MVFKLTVLKSWEKAKLLLNTFKLTWPNPTSMPSTTRASPKCFLTGASTPEVMGSFLIVISAIAEVFPVLSRQLRKFHNLLGFVWPGGQEMEPPVREWEKLDTFGWSIRLGEFNLGWSCAVSQNLNIVNLNSNFLNCLGISGNAWFLQFHGTYTLKRNDYGRNITIISY